LTPYVGDRPPLSPTVGRAIHPPIRYDRAPCPDAHGAQLIDFERRKIALRAALPSPPRGGVQARSQAPTFIIMPTSYAIEPDPNGGFLVRAIGLDDGSAHIALGFSTRAKAQDWIKGRLRLADLVPSPSKDS
jgi:hypothetical protein